MKHITVTLKEAKKKTEEENEKFKEKMEEIFDKVKKEKQRSWYGSLGRIFFESMKSSMHLMLPALPDNFDFLNEVRRLTS